MSDEQAPQALQAEAQAAEDVEVEFQDHTWVLPATLDEADGDVLDAIDEMKLSHALRGLMGDEQWDKFKATKPKVKDYGALFDAYANTIGLGSVGE